MDIKSYREKHGLSQKAFADKVGVSQGMVWQWESGETAVTLEKAKTIVRETAGEVTPHDCIPDTFPSGFQFPPEPEAQVAAA